MRIFVDADACPVKNIVIEVCEKYQVAVVLVCSVSHYSPYSTELVEYIIVDNIPQAADMAIVNRIKKGDILITQDYGLASLVLSRGCVVLHHTGKRYTLKNIDNLLIKRHIAQKIRRGGGRTAGPKAFTKEDRLKFREALEKVVLELKKE